MGWTIVDGWWGEDGVGKNQRALAPQRDQQKRVRVRIWGGLGWLPGWDPAWVSRAAFLGRFCLRLPWGLSMETREGSGFIGISLHLESVFLSPSPCHSRSLFPYLFMSASLTLLSPSSPIFLLTSHQCPHPPPHPSPFEARGSQEGLAGAGARGHLAETRLRGLELPRPSSSAIPEDLRGPGLSLPGQGTLTGCAGLLLPFSYPNCQVSG